ncbi:MAG: hypothetical protein AAF638_10630 [Pseudomonadota bacterium]
MLRLLFIALTAFMIQPATAQEQQAGNDASTNTEATFQALIDACDDVDALMLRARIRLQIPRATEDAATRAQTMLDEAFATCGGGDLEGAKAQLAEALTIAEAGTAEMFAVSEAAASTEQDMAANAADEPAATDKAADKPWWQFW